MSDPRVFFAAERTLLAWIRTGLTVMAFGFVVARFGLFLRMLAAQHLSEHSPLHVSPFSSLVGIALVATGAATLFFAALQHRQYVAGLPAIDIPRGYRLDLPIWLALLLGALGIALAVYLAL
jgi:putative membrane protein